MREFVKSKLEGELTGHDYQHAERVYTNARLVGEGLDLDWGVVEAACMTHDLIDRKVNACSREDLMAELRIHYEPDRIDSIMFIIENMSYSKGYDGEKSLEFQVVQDADRLEALGAVGIARCFSMTYKFNRPIHLAFEHFHEKLYQLKDQMNLETSRELAVEREAYMREFERRFLDSE